MKTQYISCTAPGCKKTFRNQSNLDGHFRVDHSEGDLKKFIGFRCKKCKRILGTKQSLKEHLYTHTGQKPYKCYEPNCQATFRQSSQLSYHKKIHFEVNKFLLNSSTEVIQEKSIAYSNSDETLNKSSFTVDSHIKIPEIKFPQLDVKLPNIFSL